MALVRPLPLAAALLAAAACGLVTAGPSGAAARPAEPVAASDNHVRPHDDPTLRRAGDGQPFYVDPLPADPVDRAGWRGRGDDPPPDVLALHSRPGAHLTLLLDVDGQRVDDTEWNRSKGLPEGFHGAWDTDGRPASFDQAERAAVHSVWLRVAEDYAPFDVDVTTEDPGPEALLRSTADDDRYGVRVLLTSSRSASDALCQSRCGGLAFVDVFDERRDRPVHQPAWVFPHLLGDQPKTVAESAAHEAGHTLGLEHHGGPGSEYYAGHGPWAPIMGVGYDRPVTQWSDGSYLGASNPGQDDVARIVRGGLPLAADDHAAAPGAATPLSPGVETAGTIGSPDDVDAFALTGCTGPVEVSVAVAPTAPDLDVALTVRDAAGRVVSVVDPAVAAGSRDRATGLDAAWHGTLTGAATVSVDGVGWGGPAGYDDHGSLGRYGVTAVGCATPQPPVTAVQPPPRPTVAPGRAGGRTTVTVAWEPPGSGGPAPTGYVVRAWRVTDDGLAAVGRTRAGATSRSAELTLPRGRYRLTVAAVGADGAGADSAPSVVVRPR